ncbi:MAG: lamin tail domain-containing protein [Planctomycetota bacterium]
MTPTPSMSKVSFTNGIDFTFGAVELAAGAYIVVVKDQNAFAARYPSFSGVTAGEYTGRLNNGGERIELEDAIGRTILNFRYEDNWQPITDGKGYSLTIIDPNNSDSNSWSEKDSWRPSANVGGSPGSDDAGIVPNPGAVVINEVMAHSHLAPDWIELYNTTGSSIDLSGWFLSDSDSNVMKYEIAAGTIIGSGQYLVFYEDVNFGDQNDPGCHIPFAFSENGEEVCLSSGLDGNSRLTGYREVEDFGASESNVSFGRYYKGSTGNYNFVAMDHNTPGWANTYPEVGPIVINEIMYHPNWPDSSPYENERFEYIELYNITGSDVNLFDEEGNPWKFTDGIEFTFPLDANIPANDYALVVKDLAAFTWRYGGIVPGGVQVFGSYDGKLSNAGEKVELSMPGDVDEFGTRYYIRIDRINYSDGSHPEDCPGGVDLWPVQADGTGKSLGRINSSLYGNDPNNWDADDPSPGSVNP